jgi:hypothetical protein
MKEFTDDLQMQSLHLHSDLPVRDPTEHLQVQCRVRVRIVLHLQAVR